MQVYADVVFNHNSSADAQEKNPLDGLMQWTEFQPASKQFPRDWTCFHPSYYEQWDNVTLGDMPDLCNRNPHVYEQLIEHSRWQLEKIGFDGFRYDMVKGCGAWMIRAIQELRALRDDQVFKPFGVENVGIQTVPLRIGSLKQMRGPTIPLAPLTFLS